MFNQNLKDISKKVIFWVQLYLNQFVLIKNINQNYIMFSMWNLESDNHTSESLVNGL